MSLEGPSGVNAAAGTPAVHGGKQRQRSWLDQHGMGGSGGGDSSLCLSPWSLHRRATHTLPRDADEMASIDPS